MKFMKRKTKRRTRRTGALAGVGGLFLASAIVRIGAGAGEAFALDNQANSDPMHAEISQPASPTFIGEDDIAPLLEALKEREERITQREHQMQMRLHALTVAEEEIDRKLAALESAEHQLRATISDAQGAAEKDVEKLTNVYANMKPKQAAALFEEMDPQFAAGFLGRMRPDAAAAIMAGLTPNTAYTISVVLAGRNADVPTE